jgi:hypothetical protein
MRPPTRINLRTHNPHNPKLVLPRSQQPRIRKKMFHTLPFKILLPPKLNLNRHRSGYKLVYFGLNSVFVFAANAAAEFAGCTVGEM